jgi:hypothetical protein
MVHNPFSLTHKPVFASTMAFFGCYNKGHPTGVVAWLLNFTAPWHGNVDNLAFNHVLLLALFAVYLGGADITWGALGGTLALSYYIHAILLACENRKTYCGILSLVLKIRCWISRFLYASEIVEGRRFAGRAFSRSGIQL